MYGAPDLKPVTRRRFWDADSPAFAGGPNGLPHPPTAYEVRVADPTDRTGSLNP
ncbi:hypothetical protein [Methylobacterium pseudosasicola]|uniref:Uncharacterized protein n=1 Tax=Methylobacterium pseudosasicola TaxID=582667 RepID=A0A1I4V3Q8_9HYPH|nr:hypothetical protein [Methylobacterium pseudosasicola]SFM95904.1 hypothetical protein SAMN05192568_10866 [Methylobacterium pseudosasicola]